MKKRARPWPSTSTLPELAALLLLTLPLTLPALQSFFTFDDLQNLNYYLRRPWTSMLSNFLVFTSLRRPLGSLFYLPVYHVFGMNPLPLYVIGLGLFYLNLWLFHGLVLKLTESRATALAAVAVAGFHPHLHNVIYNFGAVYELTCMTAVLGALHCHLKFLESGRRRWRWWTILVFLIGLNAKETAVAIPALLAAYEVIYRLLWTERKEAWTAVVGRIAPLVAIAAPYTLAKTLGEEAFWRENPLYRMHWDWTLFRNLAAYFTELVYGTFRFSVPSAVGLVVALVAAAWILRNRHMLFGIAFAFLTLAPVLALPRVWGLFLYIPLAGVALYVGSLAVQSADVAAARLLKPQKLEAARSWSPVFRLGGACLLAALMLRASLPGIAAAREMNYFGKTFPWRSFARQLYEMHPSMAPGTVLGFENPPFDLDQPDRWCLHFLVWLKYKDPALRVLRLPEERERFALEAGRAPQARRFAWERGVLRELTAP